MYFVMSVVMFLTGFILYEKTGDFNIFFKLLIISCGFGLCDSISDLSLKKFVEAISRFQPVNKERNQEK